MAKEYITIRVPKELKEDIEDLAKAERRSISQMALLLLEAGLKHKLGAEKSPILSAETKRVGADRGEPAPKARFSHLPVLGEK